MSQRFLGEVLGQVISDALSLARSVEGDTTAGALLRTVAINDSFHILAMTRLREASRLAHPAAIPLKILSLNRTLRLIQQAIYGIEIGKDVTMGAGVYFVHSLGIVIGGNAVVGDRVRFMGNNTVGTAKDNGYPVIEDDVVIGCGARILGPIRIGARSAIGANAVVVADVPPDSVAVGIPAVAKPKTQAVSGRMKRGSIPW